MGGGGGGEEKFCSVSKNCVIIEGSADHSGVSAKRLRDWLLCGDR